MQKLSLLGLFLSCFEIQNVLGNELLEHFGKVPQDPRLRPMPPFQDCWNGNKCQLDEQCGKNGKCKILHNLRPRPWRTGYSCNNITTLISLINVEVGINVEGVQKLPNH